VSTSVADLYEEHRPAAFAVAYRMLGSVSEAEDAVQEAFLRLHGAMLEVAGLGGREEARRELLASLARRLEARSAGL
jgi:DNA-directed RNA polymerase specialized sigma24 family protein